MTRGTYAFDYGDTAATAPILKMYTLGHTFVPPGIHAGGLRYHGMAASVSALVNHGDIEARAVQQLATFEAAVQFSKSEGIIPAPESAHAIRVAIDIIGHARVQGVVPHLGGPRTSSSAAVPQLSDAHAAGEDARGRAPAKACTQQGESPCQAERSPACNRRLLRRGDTGWRAAGGEQPVRNNVT